MTKHSLLMAFCIANRCLPSYLILCPFLPFYLVISIPWYPINLSPFQLIHPPSQHIEILPFFLSFISSCLFLINHYAGARAPARRHLHRHQHVITYYLLLIIAYYVLIITYYALLIKNHAIHKYFMTYYVLLITYSLLFII